MLKAVIGGGASGPGSIGAGTMDINISGRTGAVETWTNMPSAATLLFGANQTITQADITGKQQVRIIVNVITPGATGAKLYVKSRAVSAGYSTTLGDYSDLVPLASGVPIDVTGSYASAWVTINSYQATDAYLAVVGSGGDGAVDPTFGNIKIEARSGVVAAIPAESALRVVGRGGYLGIVPTYNPSNYARAESRKRMVLGRAAVRSIRLVYWNGYITNGENTTGLTDGTIQCAIEKSAGGAQTVVGTFNGGSSTVVLTPGQYAVSDPFYPSQFGLTEFPANWDAFTRTDWVAAGGTPRWPTPQSGGIEQIAGQWSSFGGGATQIANTGALTGTTDSPYSQNVPGPVAIIGEWVSTPDVSAYVDGDSIVWQQNDSNYYQNAAAGGYVTRALNALNIPYIKGARLGELANNWTAGNTFRKYLFQFCTNFISNIGVNDRNTYSAAQIVAVKQTQWADFRAAAKGRKFVSNIQITPVTSSSSDNYTTVPGQTVDAQSGKLDTINSTILGLVGTSTGPEEQLSIVGVWRDAIDSQRWVVNGTNNYATSDGTHPSAAIHALGDTQVIRPAATLWSV